MTISKKNKTEVIKIAAYLEPVDVATLNEYSKSNGLRSTSAAIRSILRDWKRLKAEESQSRRVMVQGLHGTSIDPSFK